MIIEGWKNVPEEQICFKEEVVTDNLTGELEVDFGVFAKLPQYKSQKWEFLGKAIKEGGE